MFTTVTDYAVARYVMDDGTQIAFAHDDMATDPVKEFDCPLGIIRNERGYAATDELGVLAEYDELTERLGDLEDEVAWCKDQGHEVDEAWLDELAEVREELKGITYLEWQDNNEYGWPEYRIAYRKSDFERKGWNLDMLDAIVKDMAREYSAWANGSVFIMGVETPDNGYTEYFGCRAGFDPYDMDEVKDMVHETIGYPVGLRAA